jgi:transcriptional regulator
MLYIPLAFKVEDLATLHAHIAATGLATLITVGDEGPIVSHVPLYLDRDGSPYGRLIGHLARANPQVKKSRPDVPAVAVFQGADAYISPRWYEGKREHGKVVPTWNYAVVHARGTLTMFDDRDRLLAVVDRLTGTHEGRFSQPWSTSDAPPGYIASQLKGIIGIELTIETLEGKHKLGQNRLAADRQNIVDGLAASERAGDIEIAEATRKTLPPRAQ